MRRLWLGALLAMAGAPALAAPVVLKLTLKDHRFSPAVLTAPAGETIEIRIDNEDPALEEFDSRDLRVEKNVGPHAKAVIRLGPLKPGAYRFEGEFHAATAQGSLTVAP
jgi:hypothetical protein